MKKGEKSKAMPVCAVLLAGGRGTRFWPRSRMRTPKQLLNITGDATMLRQTVKRLESVVPAGNMWVVTNVEQAAAVRREMRGSPASQVLAEPVGRNTAAAIGLAAVQLAHKHGDALMAVLPSDSYIADMAGYRKLVRAALALAQTPGNLVVMGVPPTRPETGYGYIESGDVSARPNGVEAYEVRRFTEKPELKVAREYAASGKYFWNAGMFFWRVSTFLETLKRFLPVTHAALLELAKSIGTRRYESALRRIYPKLESISVDYAIMEPATRTAGDRPRLRNSRKNRLERHRLLGRRLRIAGGARRRQRIGGRTLRPRRRGQLFLEPQKIRSRNRRAQRRARRNPRRTAALFPRALAGRGQDREMAGGKKATQANLATDYDSD